MRVQVRAGALLCAALLVPVSARAAAAQNAQTPGRPEYVEPRLYSAGEATETLAEAGTCCLPGRFAFIVKGVGRDGERIFLNSAADYRDPGTLTVVVTGPAARALTEQHGESPERRLIGKTIIADGVAMRVRINLLDDGSPTGFYFQTRVGVTRPEQIQVVPGRAALIVATPEPAEVR